MAGGWARLRAKHPALGPGLDRVVRQAIATGFAAQYRELVARRAELLAILGGPLAAFAGATGRYILRASYIYDKFLKRLALPQMLGDEAKREAEFAKLAGSYSQREGAARVVADAPDGGLYHGLLGTALFLAGLARVTSAGDRAGDVRAVAAWCKGAAGIGLARLSGGTPDAAATRARAVEALAEAPPTGGDTACCGEVGRIELLLAAGETAEARRRAASLSWRLAPAGWPHESPGGAFCPSYFHGAAGVGYVLLRAADATGLPCVLLLEPR